MDQVVKRSITDRSIWGRVVSMLVLAVAYGFAETVLIVVVLAQLLIRLFSGSINQTLQGFGRQLTDYVYQIFMFQTFNSEYRPFPYDGWAKQRVQ